MKRSLPVMLGMALMVSGCVHRKMLVATFNGVTGEQARDKFSEARHFASVVRQQIADFQRSHDATNLIRVVYFVGGDSDPLPNWEDRLNRVLQDISDFYQDGMQRYGFDVPGLPWERKDGRIVFHLVRGRKPAGAYDYPSGLETAKEIRQALEGIVDMDREHVLVIYGLCRKEPDGRYVFHAPYYGEGNSRSGICHAADCELLDPLLLGDTNRQIVFTEHYYQRVEQTVGKFNSWYIGGMAHELGHALGLAHDAGSPWEGLAGGRSLMADGNLHYREDQWGGTSPAYLSFISALQLASQPLFTQSDHDRWKHAHVKFDAITAAQRPDGIAIAGRVTGEVNAYAVICRLIPANEQTDHMTVAFAGPVRDGSFDIDLPGLPPGSYHLQLCSCHLNGEIVSYNTRYDIKVSSSNSRATGEAERPER